MPYKYIGDDELWYTREVSTPKVLFPNDIVPTDDVDYMKRNHPTLIEAVDEDMTPVTSEYFIDLPQIPLNKRPPTPDPGHFRLYVKDNGGVYVLDSNGLEMAIGDQQIQTKKWS
jgi:hypothetical protein